MCSCLRLAPDSASQQSRYPFVVNAARSSRSEFIIKPGKTPFHEASAPFADRCVGPMQSGGDFCIAYAIGGPKHNPRTGNQRMRQTPRARQSAELNAFILIEKQFRLRPANRHAPGYSRLRIYVDYFRDATLAARGRSCQRNQTQAKPPAPPRLFNNL